MAVVLGISNNRDSIAHAIEQLEASGKLYELKRGYDNDPNSTPPVRDAFSGQNEGQRPRRRAENLENPNKRDDNPRNKKYDKDKGRLVGTHIGRVDMTKSGAAFIIFSDFPDDVYVHQRNLNTALNDDKAEVEIYRAKEGKRPEGVVIRVVERGTERIIGTYRQTRRFNVVVPDQRGMPDVIIPEEDSNGAVDGERVAEQVPRRRDRRDRVRDHGVPRQGEIRDGCRRRNASCHVPEPRCQTPIMSDARRCRRSTAARAERGPTGSDKSAVPTICKPGINTNIPTSNPSATPRGTDRRVNRHKAG